MPFGSTPVGSEGSRIGQREALNCEEVAPETSAAPRASFGVGLPVLRTGAGFRAPSQRSH